MHCLQVIHNVVRMESSPARYNKSPTISIRDSTNGVFDKRAFGPSRNFFRHSLGICLTETAKRKHALVRLVKTFATIAVFDSAIRTDLDSLFMPSFPPQSAANIAL